MRDGGDFELSIVLNSGYRNVAFMCFFLLFFLNIQINFKLRVITYPVNPHSDFSTNILEDVQDLEGLC